jgi:predicted ATPase
MSYHYSTTDKNNIKWMESDVTCATLNRIFLTKGNLRGLGKFDIAFTYPLTAIAGKNGSGKSTLLAIATCAFHNLKNGYKPISRQKTYYTFSDFFIQSREETPPQGIEILYQIRHNNWYRDDPGLGWQSRKKRDGGKWTDYGTRVRRNVIYFGVQRVVPHFERSTHKSYRRRFLPGTLDTSHRNKIQEIAGRILERDYSDFEVLKHSKYSLPVATYDGVRYSGFNMGSGESAVFDILASLIEAGRGALLVIDELELGLHEKAQRRLIHELKELCKELHCQIICSTHSPIILDELPPEGRFYIENAGETTKVIPGISSALACGKMSGRGTGELCLFVEDETAEAILNTGLPLALRKRVDIYQIGSFEAVLRQLTSRYIERRGTCLAILDGDQRASHESAIDKVAKYSEASTDEDKALAKEWGESRINYLPEDTWPERWLIKAAQVQADKTYLIDQWRVDDVNQVDQALETSLLAGKHKEFFQLGEEIEQAEAQVRTDVIRFILQRDENPLEDIINKIEEMLTANA